MRIAIGTAALIATAASCAKHHHSEGPSCALVLVFTPAAAGLGALLGHQIAKANPVREWQSVTVVK